jgi:molecular chaperone GrpE
MENYKDEENNQNNSKNDHIKNDYENHDSNLAEEHKLLDDEHEGQKLITEEKDAELISNLTEQIEIMQDKLLRAIAESENTRHRMNKKIEEAKDYAIVNFARDLVPVIDNFSRALSHVPENLDNDTNIIIEGVTMTRDTLVDVFKKHGIESIEPQEGENFDYNNHYAISQVVTDQHKEGTIVSTMQVGYKIRDRLIRPASVAVAKK